MTGFRLFVLLAALGAGATGCWTSPCGPSPEPDWSECPAGTWGCVRGCSLAECREPCQAGRCVTCEDGAWKRMLIDCPPGCGGSADGG